MLKYIRGKWRKLYKTEKNFLENDKIKQIREYLCAIPNINKGGCGIAAMAIGEVLVDQGYTVKYVLGSEITDKVSDNVIRNIRAVKNPKKYKPTATSHYFLYCEGIFFDSIKEIEPIEYDILQFSDVIFVTQAVEKSSEWNRCFNRGHYEPLIRDFVKELLN